MESEDDVESLPTTTELTEAQANVLLCQNLKVVVLKIKTITVSEDRLLCKNAPSDVAIQIIVFDRNSGTLIFHGHSSALAGQPETRKLYDVLRKTYCWLHMATAVL